MDKSQALQSFWSSFGLPAYAENTVPDDAQTPYITYEASTDSLGNTMVQNASLWYRSMSWKEISQKAEDIARYIATMDPPSIPINNGRLYITKGSPFAQRMGDEGGTDVRRILLTVNVEFFTAY